MAKYAKPDAADYPQPDSWKAHINRMILAICMRKTGITEQAVMKAILAERDKMAAKLQGKRFKNMRAVNERIIAKLEKVSIATIPASMDEPSGALEAESTAAGSAGNG